MKHNGGFTINILGTIFLLCPCVVFAAAWDDPNVVLVQSTSDHAYRDAKTGQYISTKGMPTQQPTNPSQNASSTQSWTSTTTTGATPEWTSSTAATVTSMTGTTSAGSTTNQKLPYQKPTATISPKKPYESPNATTFVQSGTTQPQTGATGAGAGNAGATPGNTAGAGNAPKKLTAGNVAKGAGAAVGAGVGGYMIYDATKGQEAHTAGDVAQGTIGGVTAGAAVGSFFGPAGTALGAGVGAVVGGLISGSQLFSETDCLTDPETKDFTCCNTAFNKGQRQAQIGDYMFCGDETGTTTEFGKVRQCLQGGSPTKLSWWQGLWQYDTWNPKCETRWCSGETAPASGLDQYVKYDPDKKNFCWRWNCVEGYTRSGDVCVSEINGSLPVNQYDVVIQKIQQLRQQIMAECGNI